MPVRVRLYRLYLLRTDLSSSPFFQISHLARSPFAMSSLAVTAVDIHISPGEGEKSPLFEHIVGSVATLALIKHPYLELVGHSNGCFAFQEHLPFVVKQYVQEHKDAPDWSEKYEVGIIENLLNSMLHALVCFCLCGVCGCVCVFFSPTTSQLTKKSLLRSWWGKKLGYAFYY